MENNKILLTIAQMKSYVSDLGCENGLSSIEIESSLDALDCLSDVIKGNERGKKILENLKEYQIHKYENESINVELDVNEDGMYTVGVWEYKSNIADATEDAKLYDVLEFDTFQDLLDGLEELCKCSDVLNIFTTKEKFFPLKAMVTFQSSEEKALDCDQFKVYEVWLEDNNGTIGKSVWIRANDKASSMGRFRELMLITQGKEIVEQYYKKDKQEEISIFSCYVSLNNN